MAAAPVLISGKKDSFVKSLASVLFLDWIEQSAQFAIAAPEFKASSGPVASKKLKSLCTLRSICLDGSVKESFQKIRKFFYFEKGPSVP